MSIKKEQLVRKKIMSYLCCSLFALTSVTATAESAAENEYSFDEMVVTATKISQPLKNVTSSVSVINQDMIKNSGAKSIAELLPYVPGVSLQNGGGLGSRTGISIRGFNGGSGSQKMLFLVDGRPANSSFKGGVDWNSIPLDTIERIEVVRGPVSALYGDNSLGGAVNIITRKPDKNKTTINTSYGSFGTFTSSFIHEGRDKDVAYMITADYGKSNGHRDHSDYEGKNYTFKLNVGDDVTFRAGHVQYDRTNPGTYGLSTSDSNYKSWDYDKVEGYYWDIEKKLPAKWDTTLRVYQNVLNTDNYYSNWRKSDVLKENTLGLQLQQHIKLSDKQTLTWGSDYQILKATDKPYKDNATNSLDTANAVDKGLNTLAIYLQSDQELTPKLHMNLGGRFDRHSVYGSQFSPKFGLAYHISNETTYKLNIARAYKAPSISDLYGKNGNRDLKPTKLWSYELGVEKQLDRATKGSITLYRMDAKDMIISKRQGGTSRKENADSMTPQGVELELSRNIDEHFDYFINYTYLDVGDMTRWASKHKGNIGINYKNRQVKASLLQQYVGTSYDGDLKTNPNAETIGCYNITNLKFTYTPSKHYEVSLGIDNLFNKSYETYKYDPMPGRSYTLSVTSRF